MNVANIEQALVELSSNNKKLSDEAFGDYINKHQKPIGMNKRVRRGISLHVKYVLFATFEKKHITLSPS